MRTLIVDDYAQRANNLPMNLGQIGKRVKLRRIELGLTQEVLATRAKVALGTLQELERAQTRRRPRQTSLTSLQKIAKVLGRSLEQLSHDEDVVAPTDPLRAGLNREDYEIARAYHEASSDVRQRARMLLQEREHDQPSEDLAARATAVAQAAARIGADAIRVMEHLLAGLVARRDVQRDPQKHSSTGA